MACCQWLEIEIYSISEQCLSTAIRGTKHGVCSCVPNFKPIEQCLFFQFSYLPENRETTDTAAWQ